MSTFRTNMALCSRFFIFLHVVKKKVVFSSWKYREITLYLKLHSNPVQDCTDDVCTLSCGTSDCTLFFDGVFE